MRLFIAINFNNETRERLISLREELRSHSQSGNFSRDENLHLTLAFIGEVSPNKLDKIKAIMDTVTFEPFPVSIERLGTFSRGKRAPAKPQGFVGRGGATERASFSPLGENEQAQSATTWWAGLREDKPLMWLQREVEHKLALCGFEMDSRDYHPHITLGREVVTDSKPWQFEPFGETVSKIDLMKSERIGGKLTYTSIYRRGKWLKPITVEPYNSRWAIEFEALKAKLLSVIHGMVTDIHHVGSTSVTGLAAKPILDVDIEIANVSIFQQVKEQLAKIGYHHEGDYGIAGREAFKYDRSELMEHHLYVCLTGNRELRRHLIFRDYLRSHPEAVREYGELKKSLAAEFVSDIDAYINGKTAFIELCIAEGERDK